MWAIFSDLINPDKTDKDLLDWLKLSSFCVSVVWTGFIAWCVAFDVVKDQKLKVDLLFYTLVLYLACAGVLASGKIISTISTKNTETKAKAQEKSPPQPGRKKQ